MNSHPISMPNSSPSSCSPEAEQAPRGLHLILLHGLCSDGRFFDALGKALEKDAAEIVCLEAPPRAIAILPTRVMTAWCDVISHDVDGPIDEEGTQAAMAMIDAAIDRALHRGWREQDIVVGGFSQGGYIVLCHQLSTSRRLAGAFAFGTYLSELSVSLFRKHIDFQGRPLLLGHGEHDYVLPPELAVKTQARLQALGFELSSELALPMGHEMAPVSHDVLLGWLGQRVRRQDHAMPA